MSEIQMDCPFCGKEKHLYYNPKKRVFICFHCGETGTKRSLSKSATIPIQSNSSTIKTSTPSHELRPPSHHSLSPSTRSYLTQQRGIESKVLEVLPISETEKGILFEFPSFDYWQERRFKPFHPRWWFPKDTAESVSRGVVYLADLHPESSRIVVVEGVLDALSIAPFENAAAVLSFRVHPNQVDYLSRRFDQALFIPDADVRAKDVLRGRFQLARKMETEIWQDYPVEAKDPNDLKDWQLEAIL